MNSWNFSKGKLRILKHVFKKYHTLDNQDHYGEPKNIVIAGSSLLSLKTSFTDALKKLYESIKRSCNTQPINKGGAVSGGKKNKKNYYSPVNPPPPPPAACAPLVPNSLLVFFLPPAAMTFRASMWPLQPIPILSDDASMCDTRQLRPVIGCRGHMGVWHVITAGK